MAGAQSTYVHTLKCLVQDLNSEALSKELTYDTLRIKKKKQKQTNLQSMAL